MENFFKFFRSNNRPAPSNPTPNPPPNSWQTDLLQHVGGMISVLEKAVDLLSKPSQPAPDFEPEESFLSFPSHRRRYNPESWTPNTVETDGLISSVKLEHFQNQEAALPQTNNTSFKDTLHTNEERDEDGHNRGMMKEISQRVKQEELLKEFKPIKVPAPENEEQKLEDAMSIPSMPDGLEQQLGMYLAIWESLCSTKGGKKRPLTCNTWLLTVEQVKDDVILKDLQESIEEKLNKISSTEVTTRGMEIEFLTKQEVDVDVNNKDGGFPGRNVVFWAVEERDENKKTRKWDVYLMFKTQVLNHYNSTKEMRDVLRIFRKKRSKDVKCAYQTSFVEKLQSIFKGYPGHERYVTNDTTFKDEFVPLLADAYWKNIVSVNNIKPKVKKSDPIIEYTNELEKLIQEDVDKERDWEKFELKVLKDPILCHLFGTLISKREYFKSKYKEKRKVLKVNPVKSQQGVVIVIEDEDEIKMKKAEDVKIKNEEIKKKPDTSDVDMFFAKFEK